MSAAQTSILTAITELWEERQLHAKRSLKKETVECVYDVTPIFPNKDKMIRFVCIF